MDQVKPKRGRPPKADREDIKRHPLGVRTTRALKGKLEAAAATTGRSLAQEVELRLEQSFQGADHISIPLALLRTLIEAAEVRSSEKWTEDLATWVAVSRAAGLLLKIYQPEIPNRGAIKDAVEDLTEVQAKLRDPNYNALGHLTDGSLSLSKAQAAYEEAVAPVRFAEEEGQVIADEIAELARLRPLTR